MVMNEYFLFSFTLFHFHNHLPPLPSLHSSNHFFIKLCFYSIMKEAVKMLSEYAFKKTFWHLKVVKILSKIIFFHKVNLYFVIHNCFTPHIGTYCFSNLFYNDGNIKGKAWRTIAGSQRQPALHKN